MPIYTNKKICKRAGVKCKGSSPKIIVKSIEEILPETVKADDQTVFEEIVYETQVVDVPETFQNHMADHQYIAFDNNQTSRDANLEDYTRKEMDVFDYVFEIKNIQEQEEREKQLQIQNGMKKEQEILIEEDFFIDSEIIEDETIDENVEEAETFFVEDISLKVKCEYEEELQNYVDIVNDSNFQCKLCPKIYQKQNITVKHLKTEHQITLQNYNYDDSNRHRKPQKELNWKCQFCPKKYTSKRIVEKHEKAHGTKGDLLHKCTCCPLYFLTVIEMEAHQYSEHEDRLVCKVEDCNKRFDSPEKLLSHSKYAHMNRKASLKKYNFVCQLCGKS